MAPIAKHLCVWLVFVTVVLVAFLCAPFQRWDDYLVWQRVRGALERVADHPDSLPELRNALMVANSAGLLWTQPCGSRPTEWYQAIERERFDASYGVVQTLAVGIVLHGNTEQGLQACSQLERRTGGRGLDRLPDAKKIGPACKRCKNGKASVVCPACSGSGKCARCGGKGVVAFSKTESPPSSMRMRRIDESARNLNWPCPVCEGLKKCTTCKGVGKIDVICDGCGGKGVVIDYTAVTNVFRGSVQSALTLIDEGQPHRQAIHALADVQRLFLKKGRNVGLSLLGATPLEDYFAGGATNATDAAIGASGAAPKQNAAEEAANAINAAASVSAEVPIASPRSADKPGSLDTVKSGPSVVGAEASLEARLLQACDRLQHEPLNVLGLTTLSEAAREATNAPDIRSRSMVAYALAHLMRGDTNNFEKAISVHDEMFPNQTGLLTVRQKDCFATCEECVGTGNKYTPCPACTGPNACPVCKGKGVVPAGDGVVPCNACRYKPICKMCDGRRKILVRCATCKGTGRVFKVSDCVQSNYHAVLSSLAVLCSEEIAFNEQLGKAAGEMDLGERVRQLQAVTNQFAGRTDLSRATTLLAAAVDERDHRFSKGGATARVTALPTLPVDVPVEVEMLNVFDRAQDVGAAVEALRVYLAEHPAAPSAGEVKTLLGRLERKQQQRHLVNHIGTAAIALVVAGAAFFLLVLVLRHRKMKRRMRRTIVLPGMGRINADAFTDPLSLTAEESRSHVHKLDE